MSGTLYIYNYLILYAQYGTTVISCKTCQTVRCKGSLIHTDSCTLSGTKYVQFDESDGFVSVKPMHVPQDDDRIKN